MKKVVIVALANDNAIGAGNDLLVSLSADLKRFKSVTMGHPVIMGRKTFESIGKALSGRSNIVVTSNPEAFMQQYGSRPLADNSRLFAVKDLPQAFSLSSTCDGSDTCFITGGASIYQQCIDMVDELDITRIDKSCPEAEKFFPAIAVEKWKMAEAGDWLEDTDRKSTLPLKFRFERWIRK